MAQPGVRVHQKARSQTTGIGGNEIGLAVTLDALILVLWPVKFVAGGRDRVCGFLRFFTHLVELRASHAHVVRFDGEDAGRRLNELLLLEDGGCAGVGRHANILEEHPAEKEVHVIGEGVELGKSCTFGCSREPSLEIDRRTADRLPAKRLAIEADMSQLVLGQFFGELANGFALKVDLAPSFDLARIRASVGYVDAFARGGAQIVFGFHVLEVERELENVLVLDVRALCNAGRRTGSGAQACGSKGLQRVAA